MFPLSTIYPAYYENLIARVLNTVPPSDLPEIDFSDLHFAGRVRFSSRHTLYASLYRGSNKFHGRQLIASILGNDERIANPDQYDWINQSGQLQWIYLMPASSILTARFRGSNYQVNHTYAGLDRQNARRLPSGLTLPRGTDRLFIDTAPADDNNQIKERALEVTMDTEHRLGFQKIGLEYIHSSHNFTLSDIFPQMISHAQNTSRLVVFAEETLTPSKTLTITAGSRFTYLSSHSRVYSEPRLSLQYHTSPGTGKALLIRGATGIYSQFLNQFDISTISPSALVSSTRFWMPVDKTLSPPRAYHIALDMGLQMHMHWFLRAEAYYKHQPRLFRINYPDLWKLDPVSIDAEEATVISTQTEFVTTTKGKAYGVALMLERDTPVLATSLRYEHNIAKRQYGFRDGMRMEPVPWSEPQRLEFAMTARPHSALRLTSQWRGSWGRVWGFRQSYYDFLGSDASEDLSFEEFDFLYPTDFLQPTKGIHRLNAFQQLDVGIVLHRPLGNGTVQIRLDILNVANRQNEANRNLVEEVLEDNIRRLYPETRYLLPRTVSMSVRMQCCD